MKKSKPKKKTRTKSTLHCSFCGKGDLEVEHLIRAETTLVPCEVSVVITKTEVISGIVGTGRMMPCICDECVAICVEVIADNKKSGAAPTTPPNHKE